MARGAVRAPAGWPCGARSLVCLAGALALAGCGDGPSYPRDWPSLSAARKVDGHRCPDLTGTYELPNTVPTRGGHRKNLFVRPHRFFEVSPFFHPGTKQARSMPPPVRLRLEGPDAQGLRVMFIDRKEAVVTDVRIARGKDFECLGPWIGDLRAEHTRAKPRHYFARDRDGRLIGHKAYAGGGLVMLLEVIPVPVFVSDHEWWRLEPVLEDGTPVGPARSGSRP